MIERSPLCRLSVLVAGLMSLTVSAVANAALIGVPSEVHFDSLAPGAPVTTIGEVTFGSNTGLDLIVSNVFDAASGDNYLGVDDGGTEVFLPFFGDIVKLDFSLPITSLAVSFISTPAPPGGAFVLSTPLGNAFSSILPDDVLGDGGEVYRVSFSSPIPFAAAWLTGGVSGVHSFNVDDIGYELAVDVPEPGTGMLVLSGLLIGLLLRKRVRSIPARLLPAVTVTVLLATGSAYAERSTPVTVVNPKESPAIVSGTVRPDLSTMIPVTVSQRFSDIPGLGNLVCIADDCLLFTPDEGSDLDGRIRVGSTEILVVTSITATNLSGSVDAPDPSAYGRLRFAMCRPGNLLRPLDQLPQVATDGRGTTQLTFNPGVVVSGVGIDERLCVLRLDLQRTHDILMTMHGYLVPRPGS